MIRKETLPNGLTLITESMPQVRSVALGVWLARGSRHEPPRLNGISHFIEHLVFKGTEKRSAQEIALSLDAIGGQMDAFTTKENTCFYTRVLDEHVPLALDILADIVRHPRFDPVEVERERSVVMEEIRMVEDTADELIYDLLAHHFYPRHPLGRPIQGTRTTLADLSRRRLLRWFQEAYRPGNLMIAAAGNLRHERLKSRILDSFGSMPRGGNGAPPTRPPRPRGGVVRRARRDLEQLHLLLGLPAFPANLRERYVLSVLNTVLGGTMSSRLFQRVREERGLSYSIYSAVHGFRDAGFMMVYGATRPSQGREMVRLTLAEMADLRDRGPRAEELRVAKEHLKGSVMLSLESTASRMSSLARQQLQYGRQLSLQQMLGGIDRVSARAVQRMAGKIFDRPRIALAAVGRLASFRLREQELAL